MILRIPFFVEGGFSVVLNMSFSFACMNPFAGDIIMVRYGGRQAVFRKNEIS